MRLAGMPLLRLILPLQLLLLPHSGAGAEPGEGDQLEACGGDAGSFCDVSSLMQTAALLQGDAIRQQRQSPGAAPARAVEPEARDTSGSEERSEIAAIESSIKDIHTGDQPVVAKDAGEPPMPQCRSPRAIASSFWLGMLSATKLDQWLASPNDIKLLHKLSRERLSYRDVVAFFLVLVMLQILALGWLRSPEGGSHKATKQAMRASRSMFTDDLSCSRGC